MENKGSRGEGEADPRARLPRARPGLESGRGQGGRGAGTEPAGAVRGPRPPPPPRAEGTQSSSPSCHVAAFTEGAGNLTLPRQRHPRPESPLAFLAAQLWSRSEGTIEREREREPCGRPSRRGPGAAAASPLHLPSRGCGAARSAEARLPVATTRRRFAARAAAAAAGTAASSYTSGSSVCNSGGWPSLTSLAPAEGPHLPGPSAPHKSQLPGLALPPQQTIGELGAHTLQRAPR